jgi:anti-sigma factor RsiW
MKHELNCQELVELVTDYLEDALTGPERRSFEQHLAGCAGCSNYVAQMRETIGIAGRLSVDDVEPAAFDTLLVAFRSFHRDSGD